VSDTKFLGTAKTYDVNDTLDLKEFCGFCRFYFILTYELYQHIIYLIRQPEGACTARLGKFGLKDSRYSLKVRRLFFMARVHEQSYNGTNSNYKLKQFFVCNHNITSPPSTGSRRTVARLTGCLTKYILLSALCGLVYYKY